MKHALALLAALTLFAIAPTPQAHAATCSWSLLASYSQNWAKTEFNPDLVCQNNSSFCPGAGGPIGTNCPTPAQNLACQQCSESGVTGWWDYSYNQSCATGPMRINGWVQYRPNHLYTYTYVCQCSEGVTSCHWN